jgi:Flp pilus assembly protein TadD
LRCATLLTVVILLFFWPMDAGGSSDHAAQGPDAADRSLLEAAPVVSAAPDDLESHRRRALERRRSGDLAGTLQALDKVLYLAPDDVPALHQRAAARFEGEDYAGCLADCQRLADLTPRDFQVYLLRGTVFQTLCRWSAALADFQSAWDLSPDDPALLNHLAWFFATCPEDGLRDGVRALALARRASRLSREAAVFDSLAAAYAELGRFDIARLIQAQVLDMHGSGARAAEYRQRLALYENRRAWRLVPGPGCQAPSQADARTGASPMAASAPRTAAPSGESTRPVPSHTASSSLPGVRKPAAAAPAYTIQIASVDQARQALEIVARLKERQAPVFSAPARIPGRGIWYRIYWGRYASRTEARREALGLETEDFEDPMVVYRPWRLTAAAMAGNVPEALQRIGISLDPQGGLGGFETEADARWAAEALAQEGLAVAVVGPRGQPPGERMRPFGPDGTAAPQDGQGRED